MGEQTMIAALKTTLSRTPCEVEYEFTKGEPAYLSGAPENCHPGSDDECDILRVELVKGDSRLDVTDILSDDENDELTQECLEDVASSARDAAEAAAESKWEARMELQEAYD